MMTDRLKKQAQLYVKFRTRQRVLNDIANRLERELEQTALYQKLDSVKADESEARSLAENASWVNPPIRVRVVQTYPQWNAINIGDEMYIYSLYVDEDGNIEYHVTDEFLNGDPTKPMSGAIAPSHFFEVLDDD